MNSILVAYASGTGCTEGVARKIGETIAGKGMKVDVVSYKAKPNPENYDAIVAGSGVRAGSWLGPAKRWMDNNAQTLKEKPLALFTVGIALAHGPDKAEEMAGYTDKLLEKTGLTPCDIGTFAGWYVPERFNWFERKILEATKAPVGDHRDWNGIENWASQIIPKLETSAMQ